MNAVGTHLFLELRDCDEALLDDVHHIEDAMVGAAREAGGTLLARSFHKFEPRGVTGIVAIAESHLSIHTWPEHSYAAADVFTCGAAFRPLRPRGSWSSASRAVGRRSPRSSEAPFRGRGDPSLMAADGRPPGDWHYEFITPDLLQAEG